MVVRLLLLPDLVNVRVTKENKVMNTSVTSNGSMKVASVKTEKKTSTTAASSSEGLASPLTPPAPPVANSDNAPRSSSDHDESESHSIYVQGLPDSHSFSVGGGFQEIWTH